MASAAFDRRKAWVKALDDHLTPLEIAERLASDRDLPFAIAPWFRAGQAPVQYGRQAWSEDAAYYTSGRGASRLIVAFSAPGGRLGVPISAFLQMLRDDVYDVILLRDRHRLNYTQGVEGLGTLLETMRRIEDFAGSRHFQQVITLGFSLSGYPALSGGRLMKAHRAISISGRYVWHPGRLIRNERPVQAFDLLCPCAPASPTELVAVYSSRNAEDKLAFELLQRTFPSCVSIPIDSERHKIFGYFHHVGLLPLFLACLLDYWDEADIRTDLLSRLQQSARHVVMLEERAMQRDSRTQTNRRGAGEWLARRIRALGRTLRLN